MNHQQQQAIKEIVKNKIHANLRDWHYTEYAIFDCLWAIVDTDPNQSAEQLAEAVIVNLVGANAAREIITLMEGARLYLPPQESDF